MSGLGKLRLSLDLSQQANDARQKNGKIGVMFEGNVFSEIVGL